MTEQQKFEAFMRDHFGYDDWDFKSDDIGYRDSHTSTAWYAWQARASQDRSAEWQPIETAPKDGTVIILARGCRVTVGHWEPERWPIGAEYHSSTGEYLGTFETGECIDAWWYSEDGGFDDENLPTHWMPLPPPPEGAP